MAKQVIGTTPANRDSAKSGGDKINANFTEVYTHTELVNEHIDWTAVGAGTIDASNYTDTDTIYSHPQDNAIDGHAQYILADGSRAGATSGTQSFTNAIAVDSTTNSTSPTTGSIQTDGGLGVASDTFIGGALDVASAIAVGSGASVGDAIFTAEGDIVSGVGFPITDRSAFLLNPTLTGTPATFGSNLFGIDAEVTYESVSGFGGGELLAGMRLVAKNNGTNSQEIDGINLALETTLSSGGCANAFGIRANTNWATGKSPSVSSTGVFIGNAGASPLTGTSIGLQVQKQNGFVQHGIWLNGNDIGADVAFGTTKQIKQHFNGTKLEFEGSGIAYVGTPVTNTGYVEIAINGVNYKFMVAT